MKTTQYFDYTRKRPDRAQIKEDWIKSVIEKPEKVVDSTSEEDHGSEPPFLW